MRRTTIALALLLAPAAAAAQLPDPSTRALGMGGAYTTLARGYEAAFWNPATLAASGRPGFSLGLPHALFEFGSNSYGLSDLRTYAESTLTDADKRTLLAKVDSSLDLRAIAGLSPIGISIGPIAISAGTSGDVEAGLGKDAVELALFGNAARSGPGQFFTAHGSHGRGWAATTLAGSFALPLSTPFGRLAVGVTAKKVWGHALGLGAETSSRFQVNPGFQVTAAGHTIYTRFPTDFKVRGLGDLLGGDGSPGSGFGLDVGGQLELLSRHVLIGAVLVNAVGSMSWNMDRLRYERAEYVVQQTASGSIVDTLVRTTLEGSAINNDATARALRDTLLAHSDFSRLLRGGVTLRVGGLRVSGDLQLRLSEGLDRQPSQALAAGAEYVLLGILPLRVGIATDFANSLTLSAGSGLRLGPINVDVGAANISGSGQPGVRVGAGLGLIF